MNPFRLLVLLVSLPLLLEGRGSEESVVEIKPIESVAETKAVEEKQEEAKEEVKTEEYIALPSNHSIGFPFDVILYITGNIGIGVLVGTVLGLFIGFKRNKINGTMKICILICGGIAMVPLLLIGFFSSFGGKGHFCGTVQTADPVITFLKHCVLLSHSTCKSGGSSSPV